MGARQAPGQAKALLWEAGDTAEAPVRERFRYAYRSPHCIDTGSVSPAKANAARTSLTRTLHRLEKRKLISSDITLTEAGIELAKKLYEADPKRAQQDPPGLP